MTWDEILADLHDNCGSMVSIVEGNFSHLDEFYAYWSVNEDHEAIDELRKAIENLNSGLAIYLGYGKEGYMGLFPYVLCQNIPAGEVTWESIAEAWIAKDFEGRAVTIALIDRMRQILWDEPFSVTWAARPEET